MAGGAGEVDKPAFLAAAAVVASEAVAEENGTSVKRATSKKMNQRSGWGQ